jgi:hypothetical protein
MNEYLYEFVRSVPTIYWSNYCRHGKYLASENLDVRDYI